MKSGPGKMAISSKMFLIIIRNILNMSSNFVRVIVTCLLIELTHALNMTDCNNYQYTDPMDTTDYCFKLCDPIAEKADLCDHFCKDYQNCTAEVERRSREVTTLTTLIAEASSPPLIVIILVSAACFIFVVSLVVCCCKGRVTERFTEWRRQKAWFNTRIGAKRPADKTIGGKLLPSEFSPVYQPTDSDAVGDHVMGETVV